MAKVILLVITVTAASARHINNDRHLVQPVNSEVNVGVHSDQLVQRRNIEYGIGVNNVPRKHEVSYHYYHIQDPSIVQNQENINADSYNYIGNENDFRLKTNLHQSEGRKIENVNGGSTLTNVKTKIDNNDRKEPCRRVTTTQRVSVILPTEYEGTLKTNVNTLNDRRNMTSIRGSNKTSGEASTNRPAQNAPKESQLPKTEERKLGMPQENENETWVWGMDEKRVTESTTTSVRTLPDGVELDDRVALAGDKCPTGFAKISDAGRGRVTTDGLLSALARLRRPPPPLPHPAIPSRHSDGRNQAPKIHSSRPSPEHAPGAETSMTVARGEGSPERLGGALRRLHYRATRRAHSAAARHHSSTPKVVVMGSSTTSDKTINTSTDSAATALTSVTGTDDSMDAEPDLIDADPPQVPEAQREQNPPSTAPPHYHRAQNSCEFDPPAYTTPQSATDTIESPRPGPARFVFDVPLPDPKKVDKPRNKTQVSQTSLGGPSTSIQIPYDPKIDPPKSPKANQVKYETHFDFEPETVKRRGSEPRMKNKQKLDKQEYYKDEVAKLRRQLEGTEVFKTTRRRSSTHQHSVPPPSCSRRQSTAAQVHVTANPLDSASSMPAGRTTIVVQQPSLSLDYGGCSTILVRDGEDGRRTSRVCSDHIQQLLDVTSQFTSEDLHEFDKRYGSPHHSRSQSVKAQRSRTGERQLLGLPQQRARVASMPNTGVEEEYYRLRHFSITGKGVVNRGDSLRSRRSRSNTSVASSASSTEAVTRASAPCSLASSRDSSAGLSTYRVLVLGGPGVGKSSLVGQFMTSEYLHAYDTSIDDESGEKSVCVLLAGEESEITFLDSPPDNVISEGAAHGYCVVYSTADRTSFAEAERRLQTLWAAGHTARRAVILVGNKADLARSRAVPTDEGKALATSYECKFIETSVGINHNVDELLVGLLTQIRLKQQHAERVRKRSGSRKNRSRARSPLETENNAAPAPSSVSSTPRKRTRLSASVKVRGLLGRVWARDSKSKSCENLHVL